MIDRLVRAGKGRSSRWGYRDHMSGVNRRGRPRLTDEQRAAQRSELLASAMDSIRARGPELSLDDIAADSGVSKPVIYGHFGDRLGLADAVAVELGDWCFSGG